VKHSPSCCFNIRVTHASGMLEGKYTENTEFAASDHRRHRPRSWLVNGVKKVATLGFLAERMTLGQASLKWLLNEPRVVTTLPNVYDDEQLREFTAAPDLPDLTDEQLREFATAPDLPDLTEAQLRRIEELHDRNFGVSEEPMSYKGEMVRDGGAYNRVYPPNATAGGSAAPATAPGAGTAAGRA
jgi:aryl-alcohol dehydrogenase-like predicted oxidoreductase